MHRFSYSTLSRWVKPLTGYVAIVLAMALLSSTLVRTPTVASAQEVKQDGQDAVQAPNATFPANAPTLGLIPDGTGAAGVCGADRNVTFTVAGLGAPLTNVEVSMTSTHTWVGDIEAALVSPAGTATHLLFSRTGATTASSFGDSSNFNGPYNFKDSAAGTHWWTAAAAGGDAVPVAAGDYRSVAAGPSAAPPALTTITTTFAGLSTGQVNGDWTLRVRDCAASDTGSITAATLTLVGGPSTCTTAVRPGDYDGNGRSDFSIVRNTGGGPTGQITWWNQLNGGAGTGSGTNWGIATDFFVPNDFDGDGKTDIAVWRPSTPFNSYFYILNSATNTLREDQFGQTGDDPTVVGDYDGDGKSDPAIYRAGAASGDHSFWWYRSSLTGVITLGAEWGQNGDFVAPGDYDGDGKFDYAVQRNAGGGQAIFYVKQSTAGFVNFLYGTPTDVIVPGYYDADCKTDIAVIRGISGNINWFVRNSTDGSTTHTIWGNSATDFPTQGDFDGDGRTDQAIWRPNADPTQCFFHYLGSTAGSQSFEWGQNGDYPVLNFNAH